MYRESRARKDTISLVRGKSQKDQMASTQNHGALQSRTASLFPFAEEDRLSVVSALPTNNTQVPEIVVTNF